MPRKSGSPDVDVAVVGAGLAGLAAAGRLRDAGRSPVVFESTDRVGGRQRSTRLAGQVLEEGAVFFGSNYPTLQTQLREVGLEGNLKVYKVREIHNFSVGNSARPTPVKLLMSPDLSVREKLAIVPFTLSVLPVAAEIRNSLGGRVRSTRARSLDRVSAEDYLTRRIGPRFVEHVASPFMEALGFAPARDWSALGAMQILAFGAMARLYGIEDGNDLLARALAQDLDVRFRHSVTAVAPNPAGVALDVEADGATDTLRCRDLVLAVPAPVTAGLLHGALAHAVGRFFYSSSLVIAVALESLDADLPAVSIFGGANGYERIRGLVAERQDPDAPVVSYCAVCHPWQYELFDAPDDEIFPLLTDVLDEQHGAPVKVIDRRVIRWQYAAPIPGPGSLQRRTDARRLARDVPHVHLAGDWLVSPSQEGALVSGNDAAEEVLGR